MGIFAIRKGERRDAWAAFLTLFALIGSHSILETARDALFLSRVPATQLPWVYLAVAAASFALMEVQGRIGRALGTRGALRLFIFVASGATLGFFLFQRALGAAGLYALYVWSGLIATLVLAHFWTLMGDLFTITDAKRIYGFIGAGSVLGAIAGSGFASILAPMNP